MRNTCSIKTMSDCVHLHHAEHEADRQMLLLYLSNGIAIALLGAFGFLAVANHNFTHVAFNFGHAILFAGNVLFLKASGKLEWANWAFAGAVLSVFVYLLATGGVGNTGPLWAYPLGLGMIYVLGAKRGLMLTGLMFSIAVLLFCVPDAGIATAAYSFEFQLRFLATFGALALFSSMHEHARARYQERLLRVSVELDRLSHTDQLTGLPNRRYMLNRLETENSRYLRNRHVFSILYADVDHFKLINDRCGHHTGDVALRLVAQALRSGLRQTDEVCRWGGEEFLILLPETDAAQAFDVAEKLRSSVAALPLRHGDIPLHLTMSFGVHTVDCQGKIDTFIHCADQKLYRAKRDGRNRIVAVSDDVAKLQDADDELMFALAG